MTDNAFLKATKQFLRDWAAEMQASELLDKYEKIRIMKDEIKKNIGSGYGEKALLYEKLEEAYNIIEVELLSRAVASGNGQTTEENGDEE